jgi:hypothetical protein
VTPAVTPAAPAPSVANKAAREGDKKINDYIKTHITTTIKELESIYNNNRFVDTTKERKYNEILEKVNKRAAYPDLNKKLAALINRLLNKEITDPKNIVFRGGTRRRPSKTSSTSRFRTTRKVR